MIYETARQIWPEAERFAVLTLHDGAAGMTLSMKAAANVTRAYALRPDEIGSLKAYLFKTFKHLVLAELRKMRLHDELLTQAHPTSANLFRACLKTRSEGFSRRRVAAGPAPNPRF